MDDVGVSLVLETPICLPDFVNIMLVDFGGCVVETMPRKTR